jgi:glycosyltransferase involved in cell wall biosynthesis
MSGPPQVSIIVPCFHAQSTILECVTSVLCQSVGDWELILVPDDGADYLSFLHARGIQDPRLRQHPGPAVASGHVGARNRGLAMARGAAIADLDADDIWRPQRLATLLPLVREHGAVQDLLECFDTGGTLGLSGTMGAALRLLGPADIVAMDFPFHLIVARDHLGSCWFDEDLAAPDAIRAAVLAARAPIPLISEALLRYRVHDQSMSQSPAAGQRMDSAYRQILWRLLRGDGYALPADERIAVSAGFRRKRELNLRHLAARRLDPATPPFINWRLRHFHDDCTTA